MVCSYCFQYYVPEKYGDGHGCQTQKLLEPLEFIKTLSTETVNHPPHYTFGKYEVIDVLEDWFPEEPYLWQVGKYIARAGRKGEELEDLKKAKWYLERKIVRLERGEK